MVLGFDEVDVMLASRFSWWQNKRRNTLEPPQAGPINLTLSQAAIDHINKRGNQAFIDLSCLDK